MSETGAEALFEVDGDAYVATALSTGPWDRNALHGGPVAALVAREIERARAGDGKRITRLTIELERPVPLAPLRITTNAVRSGGRIEIVDAEVRNGDLLVTRARALRIREAAYDDLGPVPDDGPSVAGPESGTPAPFEEWGWTAFHSHAVEMRMLGGRPFSGAGAAVAWIRPMVPVVPGEPMSPFQRAAAVADFGNGISAAVDPQRWVFINPDLTISAHRPPVGEWICLDARTAIDPAGVGLAQSTLHDERGEFGRAVQLLYVAPR